MPWGVLAYRAVPAELRCGEVVMKERLAVWAILAGGVALTGTAFFASAGVTHWAMSQHRTEVVVRPGPTVYVTRPAGHPHARRRVPPTPAPAVPAGSVGVPSQQDARARPDHRRDHARQHHRGAHTRDHQRPAYAWQNHKGRCHEGHHQAQRIIPAAVAFGYSGPCSASGRPRAY